MGLKLGFLGFPTEWVIWRGLGLRRGGASGW